MRWPRLLALPALLVSLLVAAASAAQEPTTPAPAPTPPVTQDTSERHRMQGGLGLMMGVPVGDFRENVAFSAGLTGHLGFGLGSGPISIGMEVTYLGYGSESRDVPLVGMPHTHRPADGARRPHLRSLSLAVGAFVHRRGAGQILNVSR